MKTNTPADSKAFTEGFMVGLIHHTERKYGYANPYDRRTQAGKDWEIGESAGVSLLCHSGLEFATQELVRLRGLTQ